MATCTVQSNRYHRYLNKLASPLTLTFSPLPLYRFIIVYWLTIAFVIQERDTRKHRLLISDIACKLRSVVVLLSTKFMWFRRFPQETETKVSRGGNFSRNLIGGTLMRVKVIDLWRKTLSGCTIGASVNGVSR